MQGQAEGKKTSYLSAKPPTSSQGSRVLLKNALIKEKISKENLPVGLTRSNTRFASTD